MKAETENYLTECGLWNNIPNINVSREKFAEMLEEYSDIQLRKTKLTNWIPYNFNDLSTRPKTSGKYFVHRKDGKVHWETWNGQGWAYNGNVITHWQDIKPPLATNKDKTVYAVFDEGGHGMRNNGLLGVYNDELIAKKDIGDNWFVIKPVELNKINKNGI